MAQLAQNGIPTNPQYQPQPAQASTSIFQPSPPVGQAFQAGGGGLFNGFGNTLSSAFQSAHTLFPGQSTAPKSVDGGPPRKRYPEYYPPKSGVDPTKTLSHFHLLLNLPVEITGLIVAQCATADGVCLSLTSKHMYTITRPLLLRLKPTAYNFPRGTSRGVPLCLCPSPNTNPCKSRSCKKPPHSWQHDNSSHCSLCASCPLSSRLSSWMPKTLKFCKDYRCNKFLSRKRLWKGRCLHGGPRPKKRREGQGSLTWTHKRGSGGWQRNGKMWKSLYTEAGMRKAMDRYTVRRGTASGYSLRQRPRPTEKRREHMVTRGCAVVTGSEMYSEWSRRMKWTNWAGAPVTRMEWEWVNKRTGEVRAERPSEEEEFGEETDGDEEMESEMDEDLSD